MVTCPQAYQKQRLPIVVATGIHSWHWRYKPTHSDDRNAAEAIRIILERQLLENSIFGKRLGVIFDDTAATCLDADRSTHFRKRIRVSFGKHEIRTIKQVILDKRGRGLVLWRELQPHHWISARLTSGVRSVSGGRLRSAGFFFLLRLIVMPLDGEVHACTQYDNLEREEDYRE